MLLALGSLPPPARRSLLLKRGAKHGGCTHPVERTKDACAFVCGPGIAERRVVCSETWDCKDSFKRHMHSNEFRRGLPAMNLPCRHPRTVIGNPVRHTGFEYLRELWDKQKCRA